MTDFREPNTLPAESGRVLNPGKATIAEAAYARVASATLAPATSVAWNDDDLRPSTAPAHASARKPGFLDLLVKAVRQD